MKDLSTLQCLIVDDNKVARVLLQQLLAKIGSINILGECEDAATAKSFLQNNEIDILFLDIEMPGMSGLELLRSLPEKPLTILTTAKQGYAVEAFELNVVDYIVKPFSLARVITAVDRAKELLNNRSTQLSKSPSNNILFVKDNKSLKKIDIDEVLWIEAKGDYISIAVPEKKYIIYGSLKVVEDKFPPDKFIKVHRSFIVAWNKIDYIEDKIIFIHGQPIPISDTYKEGLLKNLNLL